MFNIPNSLTLLRIALIPVFVLIFYLDIRHANFYACAVFVLAALTDMLDGYLARKLEQTSKLGAFLDPVADKLMVAVVLVLLVEKHPTPWLALPAAVIIGREITVSALREWMAELGARSRVSVSNLGKFKTGCQMTSLILLILGHRDIIKAMDHAEPLGRVDTRLMGLIGKVKDAPQGYAGFFDAIKVKEEDLARIYAFDENMLNYAEEIAAGTAVLEKAVVDDGDISGAIRELDSTLKEANATFDSRDEVIKGIGEPAATDDLKSDF